MQEDVSIRPYFVRAVYQWCVDKSYTPYLVAKWSDDNSSAVPKRLISGGKIVFNISPEAVRHFVIDAENIFFTARFLGKTTEVQVPIADVASVYARETNSGISFQPAINTLSDNAEKQKKELKTESTTTADKEAAKKILRSDRNRRKITLSDIEVI